MTSAASTKAFRKPEYVLHSSQPPQRGTEAGGEGDMKQQSVNEARAYNLASELRHGQLFLFFRA
jgi:hypothetical protein